MFTCFRMLEKDMAKLIGLNGRIVVIGNRGSIEINARALMQKNSSVMGIALGNSSASEFTEIFAYIQAGLENKTLSPVISSFSFTLDTAGEAHKHIIERPSGTIGKVIIRCS